MATNTLDTRITTVADGIIGVQMGLMSAQRTLGEQKVAKFLDKVPEKGEALWLRFRAAQRKSNDEEYNFLTFIAEVLAT